MAGIEPQDRIEITDILHRVAYILDAGEYARMGEVFDDSVQFSNPGRLTASGLPDLQAAFAGFAAPSLSHHITNLLLTAADDGTVQAQCKALALRADRTIAAAEYTDILRRTPAGWRIAARSIRPI